MSAWCPWPGLPDELVRCPNCGKVPKVMHGLALDDWYVWNANKQKYVEGSI